jgi:outer membrane lipoprotein carrier protein
MVLLGAFASGAGVVTFAQAQPGGEQALVRRFEARYRGARSLQANFLERYSERGKTLRMDAGVAYFRRPGKMRWNYESPEKNVFVVDGKTAWFYVPADRTVTKMKAKESSDWRTPLSLLAGEMKVSRVCSSVELANREKSVAPGHAILHCRVRGGEKDAAEAQSASFEIVESTGDLVRVVVAGPGGTELEFQFAAWRINPPLEDSLFRFEAPMGTAIVNEDSVAGGDGRNHPQP